MNCRVRIQLAEALGPVNRYFCARSAGREVSDPELLLAYFIKSGGAKDFARRYNDAMGATNRWYCSEFYGQDIRDPDVLWDYYVAYGERQQARPAAAEMRRMACAGSC